MKAFLERTISWLSTLLLLAGLAVGQDRTEDAASPPIFSKTWGGKQYWGDVAIFHDWHIQQNVFTGHYRLLDGEQYRHAWGSWETCKETLDKIKSKNELPAMSGKAVILVHGLLSSSATFRYMADDLRDAGYMAAALAYPSGQVDINEAAGFVHRALESLEGVEEINLVTHSLGGLVVRACLAKHPDERVKRIVLIGVPNTGAHLADLGEGNLLWRAIGGPAGQQLVTDPAGVIACLPPPPCDFAVIAGGRSDNKGFSPLIPGDDDGTVAVSSTQLSSSADFSVIECMHKFLPKNEEVRRQTLSFIQNGRLRDPAR